MEAFTHSFFMSKAKAEICRKNKYEKGRKRFSCQTRCFNFPLVEIIRYVFLLSKNTWMHRCFSGWYIMTIWGAIQLWRIFIKNDGQQISYAFYISFFISLKRIAFWTNNSVGKSVHRFRFLHRIHLIHYQFRNVITSRFLRAQGKSCIFT